jgi:hypothetical protein
MNVSLLMFVCLSLKQICLLQVFMADWLQKNGFKN